MSKYNIYAKRVDELAKKNFAAYMVAKEDCEAKRKVVENHPYRAQVGIIPAEQAASLARAKADYAEAMAKLEAAAKVMADGKETVRDIQREFMRQIDADYALNPEALDMAALKIVESGVMKPAEYSVMLEKYSDNPTMARMIGQNAKDRLEKTVDPKERKVLRSAMVYADSCDGSAQKENFDGLCTIYDRCVNNPLMVGMWESFTAEMVENF